MSEITIRLEGLEKYQSKLEEIKKRLNRYMTAAALEASRTVILPTVGVQKYPPITSQRRSPDYPYYHRGMGTWTSPDHNTCTSEEYGKQWYHRSEELGVRVGNSASYAQWLVGKNQATRMAGFGWRKISDVAEEKKPQIKQVFLNWLNKLLHDVGLK